jgi:chemotaxis protein CheX
LSKATEPVYESLRLAESLDEAVKSTFEVILGERPTCCGSVDDSSLCPGMVGIIAVIGDVSWSLSLAFSSETAVRIAKKFAGFEIEYDSADMADVVGELANVLAGDVVARLDELGIKAALSLPTVARVSDLKLSEPGAVESLRLKYSTSEGTFLVGLAVGKSIKNSLG